MGEFTWDYLDHNTTASGPTGSLQFRGDDNGTRTSQSGSDFLAYYSGSRAPWNPSVLIVSGTFRTDGAITASSFHIEDVTNFHPSGNTSFGNTYDDGHKFSGSLYITSSAPPGSIGLSLSASANLSAGQLTTKGKVLLTGSLSSSGEIFANSMRTSGQLRMTGSVSSSGELYGHSLRTSGVSKVSGALEAGSQAMIPSGRHLVTGTIFLTSSIASEFSGAISSSMEIFGANLRTSGQLQVSGTSKLKGAVSSSGEVYGFSLRTSGQLKSSGSVSGSGELFGHNIRTSGDLSTSGAVDLGSNVPTGIHNVEGALYLTSSLASRISGNVNFKHSTVMITGSLRLTGSEASILVIEKAPGDSTKEIVFVEEGTDVGGIYYNDDDDLNIRNEVHGKDLVLRVENSSNAGKNLIRVLGTSEGVIVGAANNKTATSLNALLDVDGNFVGSGSVKATGHISTPGSITASLALSGTNLYLPAPSGTRAGKGSHLAVDNTGKVILTPEPTPLAGSDNQVQFNNNGAAGASANLTWDDKELRVVGQISASTLKVHGGAGGAGYDSGEVRTSGSVFADGNAFVDGETEIGGAISASGEIYGFSFRTSGDVKATGSFSSSYFQIEGSSHQAFVKADGGVHANANQIILGTNGDVDINLDFSANSNDGRITWSEDEDYFAFADDIAMPAGEAIFFRDADQKVVSDNAGHLDLYADDNIEFHAEDVISSGTLQVLSSSTMVLNIDAEDGPTGDAGLLRGKQIVVTQHNMDLTNTNTSRWIPWQDDVAGTNGIPRHFRIQPFGGRLLKIILGVEFYGASVRRKPLAFMLHTGSAPYGGAGATMNWVDSVPVGWITASFANEGTPGANDWYPSAQPAPMIANVSGSGVFQKTGSFYWKPGKVVGLKIGVGSPGPEVIMITCVWEYDLLDEFFFPIQAGTGTM
jgi:hypothetical protein